MVFTQSLKDFRDNLLEKAKNPFAGTFIFTWVLHNWKLVFMLFNFDAGTKLESKTELIQAYISNSGAEKLLWLPIGYAFLAILMYLLLRSISLVIFESYAKWVKPTIYKMIDKNKIVEKTHTKD
ncbi:MAG TPA: hypothetical protein VN922_05590 [Bacteroidia bacterium]|nr:hypothetical protein [Bacteroidia bacterium]